METQEEKLKQLDLQLQEERKLVARLQTDSDKLFETEEALARLQSDLEASTKRYDISCKISWVVRAAPILIYLGKSGNFFDLVEET